ncbi:MAG TPA: hypothetical protein VM029_20075 [Opitutaceae bacterium]|nr:hypothetical protein [Opitutaceae bacterium]
MNASRALPVYLLAAVAVVAAPAPAAPTPPPPAASPAPPAKKKESEWVFSLLPKSLQKNPRLELTVITEMTDAGRKLPPVSPSQPAYVELFSPGPRHLGHAAGNDATLKQPEIERLLVRALGATGYLPATPPEQRPSLLIIYTWGSHNLLTEGDAENPVLSGEMLARNMLDRAGLVGGEKFAREMLKLFQEADALSLAARAPPPPGGEPVLTPELVAFVNPVEQFKRRSYKNEAMVDQAASDVYYVVASAYDYRSAATSQKILLWRTRMTVASAGVSAAMSLPTLVLTAGPYFGKDMPEPEILSKRSLREGNVEIGTPTVVEDKPATKK